MKIIQFKANVTSSRGWDFLRGWMSLRVRGKRSSKEFKEEEGVEEMDMEIDKEEHTEHVIIARIGNESENKVVEKQNRRTCDIITINGRVGFLQKVSTDV